MYRVTDVFLGEDWRYRYTAANDPEQYPHTSVYRIDKRTRRRKHLGQFDEIELPNFEETTTTEEVN